MTGPPNTVPPICKPVIIETDGVFGELETGAIINAGGTSNGTFTVNGKQVLTSGSALAGAVGYEFIQATPVLEWFINHNGDTLRAVVQIYDLTMKQILPEEIQIVDLNNVTATFNQPQAGIALIILF